MEERRLLYVAMTRARSALALIRPLRFYVRQQHRHGDRHVLVPRSRFIPDAIVDRFTRETHGQDGAGDGPDEPSAAAGVDVAAEMRAMWK